METPPPEDNVFSPPNHTLISVYLRHRAAADPLPPAGAAFFHDVDIYSAEPAALTAGLPPVPAAAKRDGTYWLFFTPRRIKSSTDSRKSRKVGGGLGTWHSEHAPEAVLDEEGNRVGHRQLFSYKGKGGRRTEWSMWEFVAAAEQEEVGESQDVLCKIHQPHAAKALRIRRKCVDDDGEDHRAPVRRRLLVSPAPPTPPIASQQDQINAAASEAIPCSKIESTASKDAPMSVISFWDQPSSTAPLMSSVGSFLPESPHAASPETVISATPASFLIPRPGALQGEMPPFDRVLLAPPAPTPPTASMLNLWDTPFTPPLPLMSVRSLFDVPSVTPSFTTITEFKRVQK